MSRTQYFAELESVRRNLIEMGETTLALLDEALHAISAPDPTLAEKASELEAQTDHQHRLIHARCLSVITRQAPVARDARLVTGVLDAIVDLELIGDYSYEIVMLSAPGRRRAPSQVLSQISDIGAKVRGILAGAIDAWNADGSPPTISPRPQEATIHAECGVLYEKLSRLTSGPGDASVFVDLMLVTRHLERIMRHGVSVAVQASGSMSTAP